MNVNERINVYKRIGKWVWFVIERLNNEKKKNLNLKSIYYLYFFSLFLEDWNNALSLEALCFVSLCYCLNQWDIFFGHILILDPCQESDCSPQKKKKKKENVLNVKHIKCCMKQTVIDQDRHVFSLSVIWIIRSCHVITYTSNTIHRITFWRCMLFNRLCILFRSTYFLYSKLRKVKRIRFI